MEDNTNNNLNKSSYKKTYWKNKNKFEDDICTLFLKNGFKFNLEDRFLYNLIYNKKKQLYSLQEQDEYMEKIEHRNND